MLRRLKNIFSKPTRTRNRDKTPEESAAIAAPKPGTTTNVKIIRPAFKSFDAVLPNQSIPGKFNYYSPTWKYLANYFADRIQKLHQRNESSKLDIEQTSIIRGQIKEIKLLIKHINHLAGITTPPVTQSLSNSLTDEGNYYE